MSQQNAYLWERKKEKIIALKSNDIENNDLSLDWNKNIALMIRKFKSFSKQKKQFHINKGKII